MAGGTRAGDGGHNSLKKRQAEQIMSQKKRQTTKQRKEKEKKTHTANGDDGAEGQKRQRPQK